MYSNKIVGALFTYTRHYRRDPARQVPPLGVGDHFPQVSRDTCSGTASIWPLRGYTRHWDGKRGDDAAFRSDISAWMCHNRLANLVACLLYAVQVAPSIGIRAPFERARPTPKAKSVDVMGARRLHTTTSSIGTYEEDFNDGLAAPRPTCRSSRLAEKSMTNIYTWWDRPRTLPGKPPRRRARQVRLQASCSTCQR